ncbi:hypothetical protein IKS86_04540 [bacterium]|nr:hypothetical protein [bacterium]
MKDLALFAVIAVAFFALGFFVASLADKGLEMLIARLINRLNGMVERVEIRASQLYRISVRLEGIMRETEKIMSETKKQPEATDDEDFDSQFGPF